MDNDTKMTKIEKLNEDMRQYSDLVSELSLAQSKIDMAGSVLTKNLIDDKIKLRTKLSEVTRQISTDQTEVIMEIGYCLDSISNSMRQMDTKDSDEISDLMYRKYHSLRLLQNRLTSIMDYLVDAMHK